MIREVKKNGDEDEETARNTKTEHEKNPKMKKRGGWGSCTVPFHTLLVTSLCVAVFYSSSSFSLSLLSPLGSSPWYTVFTASLSHASASHLWFNVAPLAVLGGTYEAINGSVASFFVFWVPSITALLAEAGSSPFPIRLVGASAGVYGTGAAYLSFLLLNWGDVEAPALYLSLFLIVSQAVFVASLLTPPDPDLKVAHLAHAVGALQGFYVGGTASKNVRIVEWERAFHAVCFLCSASTLGAALARALLPF